MGNHMPSFGYFTIMNRPQRLLPNDEIDVDVRTFPRKKLLIVGGSIAILVIVAISISILVVKLHSSSASKTTSITAQKSIESNQKKLLMPTSSGKQEGILGGIDSIQLLTKLADKFFDLNNWSDYTKITLFNKTCTAQVKGRLHKFDWVYDGRLECSGVVGESRHSESRAGAFKSAVKDYLTKSGQAASIPDEQLQQLG